MADPGLKATEESECELELRDEFHEAPKCLIKSLSQPVQGLADRYIPLRGECQLQDLLLNVSLDDSGAKAAEAGQQQSNMKPSEFKSLLVNQLVKSESRDYHRTLSQKSAQCITSGGGGDIGILPQKILSFKKEPVSRDA